MTTQGSIRKIMEAVEDARYGKAKHENEELERLLSWDKVEIIKVKVEGSDK